MHAEFSGRHPTCEALFVLLRKTSLYHSSAGIGTAHGVHFFRKVRAYLLLTQRVLYILGQYINRRRL
jgi:hypothetical protein